MCFRSLSFFENFYLDVPKGQPEKMLKYAPDKVADIEHIKLEISFDFKEKKIFGICSTTLSAINNNLCYVVLDCVELDVENVTNNRGVPLKFSHDGEKLTIYFKKPLKESEKDIIIIKYSGKPRCGLYFTVPTQSYPGKPVQVWTQGQDEDSRYYLPCFDYPNEKATSEMIITVPSGFTAISNGALLSVTEDKKKKTKIFHWYEKVPHVSYLMSLAAGKFDKITDTFNGIPVEYYFPKGRAEEAKRAFGRTPDMLKFFSDYFGYKYPYEKYAQVVVEDFIFGGMENISATTLIDRALHDARAHLDYAAEPLVSHELTHQWFGDLLTCKDWSHAWLNEGFATYGEILYDEHYLNRDEAYYDNFLKAKSYFNSEASNKRPVSTKDYKEPIDLFDPHIYEKGGWILHMLRGILGEENFRKMLKHYTNKFARQVVQTEDLCNAITESTGYNLEWFFDEWVYKPGYPEFKVTQSYNPKDKQLMLTVDQAQKTDDGTPVFRMPIKVRIVGKRHKEDFKIEIEKSHHVFHLTFDEEPLFVRFDPNNMVLKKLEFSKPLKMLITQIETDEDIFGRIEAAHLLAKNSSLDAIGALEKALLKDGFWGVQAEIAEALSNIGSKVAYDALSKGIKIKHPKARRAVVKALGTFKTEECARVLIPVAKRDTSYFVEAEASLALGKTGCASVMSELKTNLKKSSYTDVIRSFSIQGIAELPSSEVVSILKECAKEGHLWNSRISAIKGLGSYASDKIELYKEIRGLLELYLLDSNFFVKIAAANGLRLLGDRKAIPALEQAINREVDGRLKSVCEEAIYSLREGKRPIDEVKGLKEDVDRLKEKNTNLEDRITKLEKTHKGEKISLEKKKIRIKKGK